MSKIMSVMGQFRDDEDGAAMIEYTILIGIITAAVVAIIAAIGVWVGVQWTALGNALNLTW